MQFRNEKFFTLSFSVSEITGHLAGTITKVSKLASNTTNWGHLTPNAIN